MYMGLVVHKVAVEKVLFRVLRVFPFRYRSTIAPCSLSFTLHRLDIGSVIKYPLPSPSEGECNVETRKKISTPGQYIFSVLKIYIWNYTVKRYRAATSVNKSRRLLLASGCAVGAPGWGTALQAGRSPVPFPPGLTIALGSTQPWTEMSTSISPGGKGGRCVRLTNLLSSCDGCLKILGSLNLLEP
jgi:hypothetical protein